MCPGIVAASPGQSSNYLTTTIQTRPSSQTYISLLESAEFWFLDIKNTWRFYMQYIRIISVPKGNAPLSIRKQWLGLKLPLDGGLDTKSAQKNIKRRHRLKDGFVVNAAQALTVLNKSSPMAGNWWRRNLPPVPDNQLVFAKEDCKLINE